jgi:predicted esterase
MSNLVILHMPTPPRADQLGRIVFLCHGLGCSADTLSLLIYNRKPVDLTEKTASDFIAELAAPDAIMLRLVATARRQDAMRRAHERRRELRTGGVA